MECLQNLYTIPVERWDYSVKYSIFDILPDKFPFTNLRFPYYLKSRYRSESWESRITQKRFVELFNKYDAIPKEISIVDTQKNLHFYIIGAGFLFRKVNQVDQYPIIIRCNEGIFVDRNLNEFEIKLLKKISTEYLVKDFVLEDLIIHHQFRFKNLKERSEYFNKVKENLVKLKEGRSLTEDVIEYGF